MAIDYQKTNWVNGQAPAISAGNLNKIEEGIKAACDAADSIHISSAEPTPAEGNDGDIWIKYTEV